MRAGILGALVLATSAAADASLRTGIERYFPFREGASWVYAVSPGNSVRQTVQALGLRLVNGKWTQACRVRHGRKISRESFYQSRRDGLYMGLEIGGEGPVFVRYLPSSLRIGASWRQREQLPSGERVVVHGQLVRKQDVETRIRRFECLFVELRVEILPLGGEKRGFHLWLWLAPDVGIVKAATDPNPTMQFVLEEFRPR